MEASLSLAHSRRTSCRLEYCASCAKKPSELFAADAADEERELVLRVGTGGGARPRAPFRSSRPWFLLSVFRLMVPVWDSVPTELSESLSTVASGAIDKGRDRPMPLAVGIPGLQSAPVAARGSTALHGRSLSLHGEVGEMFAARFLRALRGGGAGGIRRGLPFTPPLLLVPG